MDERTLLDRVIRAYFRGHPDRPQPANSSEVLWDDDGATIILENANGPLARYRWHADKARLRRPAGSTRYNALNCAIRPGMIDGYPPGPRRIEGGAPLWTCQGHDPA